MPDDLKTRVYLNLVLQKPIVGTFVVGMGLLFLATIWMNPFLVIAGTAAVIGAGVAVAYRFLFKREAVIEEVQKEIEQERAESRQREQGTREAQLDELRRRLFDDRDPRTEDQLDALRQLSGEFSEDSPRMKALTAFSSLKIREGVNQLFERSIRNLEESLRLYQDAGKLPKGAAAELLKVRRELLADVDKSIESIGKTFAGLHRIGLSQLQTDEQDTLRQELEDNLDTALAVDALSRGGRAVAVTREQT